MFVVRLAARLVVTVLELLVSIYPTLSLLVVITIALLLITPGIWWWRSNQPVFNPPSKLEQQYDQLLTILRVQPTHRDVLYQASLVADHLGYDNQSKALEKRARYQDPNWVGWE